VELDPLRSHCSWFGRGRDRVELDGVDVFLGPRDATIAFPAPGADLAGAVRLAVERGVREVGCWAYAPDDELGARMRALGFQDGWSPHWMGIDPRTVTAAPDRSVEETVECADGLPYGGAGHGAIAGDGVHHFVVREGEAIVGHAVLDVAGDQGGIYDMGVAPHAQRRGHATALTLAAVARAREEGCTGVTLNATGEGEPVYRSVGFDSLGWGMTWWLFPQR
jgi:ribosomal protein S18 acetylase RimI-like enzyme